MPDQAPGVAETGVGHVVQRASGCGRTRFDAQGVLRQESRYLVRIWCECGWTGMADMDGVSELWKQHHSDGTNG